MRQIAIRIFVFLCFGAGFGNVTFSQVIVAFQGGEPGDTWGFTSTGASAIAIGEALLAPNKTNGTKSLVVGGDTGGGSCFSGGSGNGPAVARTFTFNPVSISTSNQSVRTLKFNWGNRFPSCSGTGWDGGEDLIFRAYHDGVAQPQVTIIAGNNNAAYSIQANQYTHTIPACVNSFYFVVYVTTNRADELLFIDDVKITAPQLNPANQPLQITGADSVCAGTTGVYNVPSFTGATYNWSISPSGPALSLPNGNSSISVNWGLAAPGNYTLSVAPVFPCSNTLPVSTYTVTVTAATLPVTISGPVSLCSGQTITLSSDHATGNVWSTTGTNQTIAVNSPGTYSVTVSGVCGNQTDQHIVTAGTTPVITSVNVSDVSCSGQANGSVSVSASGTNLEYSKDGVNWQSGPLFDNLAPGTYTISLHEAGGGCNSDTTITISEPQPVTAQASNSSPVCEGQSAVLSGNASGTPATFSWTGPNGYTSSAQNPADAAQQGTYTLVAIVSGCSSQPVQTVVSHNPVPVATSSSAGNYCSGQVITLTGSSDIPTGASYSWSGPNSYSSSSQNPSDVSLPGTYALTVTVNGCSGLSSSTSVSINPVPDASAAYNSPYCPGTALLLTGTTSATGNVSYSWSGPNGYISTVQNPTDAVATGTYSFTVSQQGCSSAPAVITVENQSPVITVSNNGPFCADETVQLSGNVVSVQTPSYTWSGPAGYSSSQQNPSDASLSGVYTLTATINNCVVQASTVITVFAPSVVDFTATEVCAGAATAFEVQTGSQIESYSWNLGDGNSASGQHVAHTYSAGGSYEVQLNTVDFNGCPASAIKTVTVHSLPEAFFSIPGDKISDLDMNVVFINGSKHATQYEWWFAGTNETLYDFEPAFDFSQTTNYSVRLIAFNEVGCSDTMTVVLSKEENPLYFIPNAFSPNGDEANNVFQPVFTQGYDPENYRLAIYNRWGEQIFESKDAGTGWDGTYSGELMAAGTYTWQITFHRSDSGNAENIQGHLSLLR